MNLQEVIDRGMSYATVELPIGEFEGPIYIKKPCTVIGNATTIWSRKGPALVIASDNVRVGNVRVEAIEAEPNSEDAVCLISQYQDTEFKNVEIIGNAKGVKGEEGLWKIPQVMTLGEFASDVETHYQMEIEVPAESEILTNIQALTIEPTHLVKGRNTIQLTLEACKSGTFIYGEIAVVSQLIRTIFVNGLAVDAAENHKGALLLYTPENKEMLKQPLNARLMMNTITQTIIDRDSNVSVSAFKEDKKTDAPKLTIAPMPDNCYLLRKGERLALDKFFENEIRFKLTYTERNETLEIDPYIILLDKEERAKSDDDLIFFGKTISNCGSIIYKESEKIMAIDLKKVDSAIERIVVAYAFYGDNEKDNFSKVQAVAVQIMDAQQEKMRFVLQDLYLERTIVALEIYRYKGSWKINAVGSGYKEGLVRLCQSYGLEIM